MSDQIKKRIIDTNALIKEKVEQAEREFTQISFANVPHIDEDGEPLEGEPAGTAEGAGDEWDESEIPPEPDLMELAEIEAENIRNSARQEADGIIAQANADADRIRADAYTEGEAAAREDLEREYQARNQALDEREAALGDREIQLEQDYERRLDTMEGELADTWLDIFEQVFTVKYSDSKELLIYLIKNALRGIRETKSYKIKVCEEDVSFVRENRDQYIEIIGTDAALDIVMDQTLAPGSIIIDADSGVYDANLNVQLSNLCKELRAISHLKDQ